MITDYCVDLIERNVLIIIRFLISPKIRPFREAHKNRQKDTELLKLAKYLKRIARLDDLSGLNHKYWERFVALC